MFTSIVQALNEHPLLFVAFALLVGLLVGSFLNVVIYRLPPILKYGWQQECAELNDQPFNQKPPPSITFDRSHCPHCKKQLSAWQNIPLFSYLFLRGHCFYCQKPIAIRYPLVESLTGLFMGFLAYYFGWGLPFVAASMLLFFLVVITFIDLDTFLIPDQLSLSLLWFGLFFSLFEVFVTPQQAIIGALVGYLSLWLLFHVFKILTGKEGMGYGDFKLLAAGGAWLGFDSLIVVLILASVSGLVIALIQRLLKQGEAKIPFGPYLSIGIFASLIFGDTLLNWYLP
ncbi:prepilin peptidase [Marinicella gelatinilytica]|uniref:prepilin peptidase n=1 Tax=Marinicella gelatinilytica TaxID=2996017 RepID=UPI002260B35E|nr:A24 family peptidase [Marinicella gelatinilytica]MCX7544677.1 A24 family peptidase [Marinicella gelatinilytica]